MTPWTAACQAPLSMGFSRQENWNGLPCPLSGDLPNPGTEPRSPALQVDSLPSEPPGKPCVCMCICSFSGLCDSRKPLPLNTSVLVQVQCVPWISVPWDCLPRGSGVPSGEGRGSSQPGRSNILPLSIVIIESGPLLAGLITTLLFFPIIAIPKADCSHSQ